MNGVEYSLTGSWNDLGLNPWQNRQQKMVEEIDRSGLSQIPEIFPSAARLGRRFLQYREDYSDPGANTDPRNSGSPAPPPPRIL